MRKLTFIEKIGAGFLVIVGLFLIYALAWTFLTDAGRAKRQESAEDRRKSEEFAAARERAKEREERGAAESEAMRTAIERWLNENNGFGPVRAISPAPDWAKGKRFNVVTTTDDALLFYFSADYRICSVYSGLPPARIFNDPRC